MKAADLILVVFAIALAAGGFGAFYYWQAGEARAAEAAYEAAVDSDIDRKLAATQLDVVAQTVASQPEGRLHALEALYADPEQNDRINLGFATVRGDFRASYETLADQNGREVESDRFRREIDERFGEGAYELMSARYQQFVADAPQRAAQRAAEEEARTREIIRAMQNFERTHGRPPRSGARLENGRFVED